MVKDGGNLEKLQKMNKNLMKLKKSLKKFKIKEMKIYYSIQKKQKIKQLLQMMMKE